MEILEQIKQSQGYELDLLCMFGIDIEPFHRVLAAVPKYIIYDYGLTSALEKNFIKKTVSKSLPAYAYSHGSRIANKNSERYHPEGYYFRSPALDSVNITQFFIFFFKHEGKDPFDFAVGHTVIVHVLDWILVESAINFSHCAYCSPKPYNSEPFQLACPRYLVHFAPCVFASGLDPLLFIFYSAELFRKCYRSKRQADRLLKFSVSDQNYFS